jgi:hypothetical protein
VAVYDKLDWHFDSAVSAGQPPENAFTHIGFYFAWLIRHDLHNPRQFPPEHVDAVKSGEMTGSNVADDIDTKLISQDMNAEGRAFSDARYSVYLSAYNELFTDLPDYGVVDEPANYRRAEQLLDRLYSEWVAEGRPKAPPETPLEEELPLPTSVNVMAPPGYSQEQLQALRGKAARSSWFPRRPRRRCPTSRKSWRLLSRGISPRHRCRCRRFGRRIGDPRCSTGHSSGSTFGRRTLWWSTVSAARVRARSPFRSMELQACPPSVWSRSSCR